MVKKPKSLRGSRAERRIMTILNRNSPIIFLSSEIIFEMLSYLPVKSLLRFKCVCKHWNEITDDFQFICLHYKRSPLIIEGKPPQTQTESNATAGCEDDEFKLLTTRGLVLEYTTRPTHLPFSPNMRYRLRNPEIQHQIFEIPDSQSRIWNMCIVFEPICHVLKLLSFVYNRKSIDYEVLDLRNEESSYSWRPIVLNLPKQQRNGETRMCTKQNKNINVLFTMGTCYVIWNIDVANSSLGIDILDMVNDSYIGHTNFPTNDFYTRNDCTIWNGKLAFVKIVKEELHVLILDFDYKKQMKLKLSDQKLIIKLPFMRELSAIIALETKLWFWFKDKDPFNCFYDIATGKIKFSLVDSSHKYRYNELTNYVFRRACLVTFKGMNVGVV